MSSLNAYLFGALKLERQGQTLGPFPTQKVRALCAYLLLHGDQSHPRALLAGTFWGQQTEARARRNLSDALWRLKRLIADNVLLDSEDAIRINPGADLWVDVHEFLRLTRPLRTGSPAPDPLSQHALRQAVALYRGDLLLEFYDDWVLAERERCRSIYLAALQALTDAAEAEGDLLGALGYAEQLATAAPLREQAQRRLMRLYALTGRSRLALEHYYMLRRILASELGVDPDSETKRLYELINSEVQTGPLGAHIEGASTAGGLLPLVGRQAERAALLEKAQRALSGMGSATMILGEAGVGKSRLIQSVGEGASWRGLQVMKAACQREGETAYGPLLRALARGLSARMTAALKELLQPDERRILARLSPDLAALGPEKEAMPTPKGYAEPTPPESPEIVSRVLAVALRAVAQTVPHILILEDVQWSDAGVRQALEALLPLLTESRLCVFMSARREALPLEGEVWQWLEALERRAVLSLLPLPPLSEAESSHLAVQALGSALPEAQFLASLYLASGGNPLFLLEMIRDWQERSAEATWEDYLADLPRTGQVEAVIGERLARLAKPALRLLEMAAVLGLESSVEALQKMAAVKSETFLARTDELLRARLLLETEAGFEFAHDLTRGVVLSGLTPKRRRALHRRAGRALQATQPLTIEAIANHWEAGEDWEQASDYLRQAGARAAAACAYPLALQFYRRALSALAQPAMGDRTQSRFQILQAQGRVFLILGDAAAMLEAAQELLSLAGELGDEEEQARAYNHLSAAHFWRGDYLASRSAAEAALAHARRAGAPDLEAWALDRLGQSYGGTGEFDQTRSLFEAALRGFEALHDQVGLSYVTGALGGLAMRQCDYARAMACYRRARDLTEALDWVSRRWMMEANLAMVEYSSGKFESALQRCAVAYAEFERWGMASYALGGVADQLARINLTLGRPAAALDWAARAQAHTDEAGYPLGVIYARLTAAAAECALGNFSAALAAARAARDQSRGMNDRNSLAMANWLLAGIERAAGDLPAALHHAETAAQLTHETGLLLIEMQACAEAARTCLEHGDPTAALGWARCGLAARDQIPGPALDSEDLHFAHHQACSAAGLEDAAREALAQAWSDAAIKASQISDPDLRRTFLEHPTNAAIVERIAAEPDAHPQQLVYLPIRLPKSQRLRKSGASNRDLVPVIWTLTAPEDPASPGPRQRRTRLRRLLVEAASQGAEPRQKDLAAALGVTVRTIRTDLKNL